MNEMDAAWHAPVGAGLPAVSTYALLWRSCSIHLRQHGLDLGQPERHRHSTVQRQRGGEFGARLLPLAGLGVEGTEAAVAVRLERAHATPPKSAARPGKYSGRSASWQILTACASRGSARRRSPWRRASRPTPHEANIRLPG